LKSLKKLRTVGVIVLLGLFIIAGLSYFDNHSNRAEAESTKTNNLSVENVEKINDPPIVTASPVNKPDLQSNTVIAQPSSFFIDVSIADQKVRIFKNDQLTKEWTVSTGISNATPLGRFKIQNRGEWFFSEKYQQGAMWWVSFKDWGVYLFHSVPMDKSRAIITDEANKLGTPASHGCVRLEIENAKWIYDNIPQGTEVYIHN
jgi:lipoprotein-anchoring transpeptidase ErfK/SrfK